VKIRRSDEVEDEAVYSDTDLSGFDEHKPVILHLLSQLKLGMDLTKVAWHMSRRTEALSGSITHDLTKVLSYQSTGGGYYDAAYGGAMLKTKWLFYFCM